MCMLPTGDGDRQWKNRFNGASRMEKSKGWSCSGILISNLYKGGGRPRYSQLPLYSWHDLESENVRFVGLSAMMEGAGNISEVSRAFL